MRITLAPLVKLVEQVPGQLIPPVLLVTVPVPLPWGVTVREKVPGGGVVVNVASTVQFAVIALVVYVVPFRLPVQVPPTDGV